MSQSVARLKELLFDSEAQALHDLAARLNAVADTDERGRVELRQLIDQVFERAGSHEKLTSSVAEILSSALRQAEVADHPQLSRSIAPLVVATIKTELRNSQDEMVEALYPITGRLVKSYVASAMKDLAADMNRRIEQNAVMLRLQSLATGRSVAQLAMAGARDFEICDVYLIRRGSGALLAHWPEDHADGRDHAMSGILAAINEFANEALAADQGSLRQIDIGDACLYLRGSAKLLLAARCTGTAPERIEQIIDDAFITAIEAQTSLEQKLPPTMDNEPAKVARLSAALSVFAQQLDDRVGAEKTALARTGGFGAIKVAAVVVLLPLLGYTGVHWYAAFKEGRVRSAAMRTVDAMSQMYGYPTTIEVGAMGKSITIRGLTPSPEAKTAVVQSLEARLGDTAITDQLAVVPGSKPEPPDLRPDVQNLRSDLGNLESSLARAGAIEQAKRAADHSTQAIANLNAANSAMSEAARPATIADALQFLAAISAPADASRKALQSAAGEREALLKLHEAASIAFTATTRVAEAMPGLAKSASLNIKDYAVTDADQLGDIAVKANALTEASARSSLMVLLGATINARPPEPVVQYVPEPLDPRRVLEDATRTNAIFFADGNVYRNPEAASATLKSLAPLILKAGVLVRVVGYTDEAGNTTLNSELAQVRADKVRAGLIEAGAPEQFVKAIGRSDRRDLSVSSGPESANRRVEFEIGFDGEALR